MDEAHLDVILAGSRVLAARRPVVRAGRGPAVASSPMSADNEASKVSDSPSLASVSVAATERCRQTPYRHAAERQKKTSRPRGTPGQSIDRSRTLGTCIRASRHPRVRSAHAFPDRFGARVRREPARDQSDTLVHAPHHGGPEVTHLRGDDGAPEALAQTQPLEADEGVHATDALTVDAAIPARPATSTFWTASRRRRWQNRSHPDGVSAQSISSTHERWSEGIGSVASSLGTTGSMLDPFWSSQAAARLDLLGGHPCPRVPVRGDQGDRQAMARDAQERADRPSWTLNPAPFIHPGRTIFIPGHFFIDTEMVSGFILPARGRQRCRPGQLGNLFEAGYTTG